MVAGVGEEAEGVEVVDAEVVEGVEEVEDEAMEFLAGNERRIRPPILSPRPGADAPPGAPSACQPASRIPTSPGPHRPCTRPSLPRMEGPAGEPHAPVGRPLSAGPCGP